MSVALSESEAAAVLRQCQGRSAFFTNLNSAEISILAANSDVLRLSLGEKVFTENERASFVGLVVEGSVAVSRSGKFVTTLGEGEILGEMSFFTGGVRNADISTNEPSTLIATFAFRQVLSLTEAMPSFGLKLQRMFARATISKLMLQAFKDAGEELLVSPGQSRPSSEQLAEMFRAAHSIAEGLGPGITDDELDYLSAQCDVIQADADKQILKQGQMGRNVIFVLAGTIEEMRTSKEEEERSPLYEPGELYGSRAFFVVDARKGAHTYDVYTKTPALLAVFSHSKLKRIQTERAELGLKLFTTLGRTLLGQHLQLPQGSSMWNAAELPPEELIARKQREQGADAVTSECMAEETYEVLDACRCFGEQWREFSDGDLRALSRVMVMLRVGEGESIMRKGEHATFLMLLASGTAEVRPHSGEFMLQVGAGELLGEVALFRAGMRSADVTSMSDGTVVSCLFFQDIAKLNEENPTLTFKLFRLVATLAIRKLEAQAPRTLDIDRLMDHKGLPPNLMDVLSKAKRDAPAGIFNSLSQNHVRILGNHVQYLEMKNGTHIQMRGTLVTAVVIILSGSVDIHAAGSDSPVLATRKKGDILGEAELMQGVSLVDLHETNGFVGATGKNFSGLVLPRRSIQWLAANQPIIVQKLLEHGVRQALAVYSGFMPTAAPGGGAEELAEGFAESLMQRTKAGRRGTKTSSEAAAAAQAEAKQRQIQELLKARAHQQEVMGDPTTFREMKSLCTSTDAEKLLSECQALPDSEFRGLKPHELSLLSQYVKVYAASPAEELMRIGERSSFLLLVLAGQACVMDPGGSGAMLRCHEAGQFVGELTYLVDQGGRIAPVMAGGDGCLCVVFLFERLQLLNKTEPIVSLQVTRMIANVATMRVHRELCGFELKKSNKFVPNALSYTVEQRVELLRSAHAKAAAENLPGLGFSLEENEEALRRIAEHMAFCKITPGLKFFECGAALDWIGIVVSGAVEERRRDTAVRAEHLPGAMFGCEAFLLGTSMNHGQFRHPHSFSASRLDDDAPLVYARLPYSVLLQMLDEGGELGNVAVSIYAALVHCSIRTTPLKWHVSADWGDAIVGGPSVDISTAFFADAQQAPRACGGFSAAECAELARCGRCVVLGLGAGRVEVEQGIGNVGFLVDGEARMLVCDKSGADKNDDTKVINTDYVSLTPGHLIGEAFQGPGLMEIEACNSDAVIVSFTLEDLREMNNPSLAVKVLQRVCGPVFAAVFQRELKEHYQVKDDGKEMKPAICSQDKLYRFMLDSQESRQGLGSEMLPQDVLSLAEHMYLCNKEGGSFLLRAGMEGTSLCLVVEGTIEAKLGGRDSKTVGWRTVGELIGEGAFIEGFCEPAYRSIDVYATIDMKLGVLTHSQLISFFKEHPGAGYRFLRYLAGCQVGAGVARCEDIIGPELGMKKAFLLRRLPSGKIVPELEGKREALLERMQESAGSADNTPDFYAMIARQGTRRQEVADLEAKKRSGRPAKELWPSLVKAVPVRPKEVQEPANQVAAEEFLNNMRVVAPRQEGTTRGAPLAMPLLHFLLHPEVYFFDELPADLRSAPKRVKPSAPKSSSLGRRRASSIFLHMDGTGFEGMGDEKGEDELHASRLQGSSKDSFAKLQILEEDEDAMEEEDEDDEEEAAAAGTKDDDEEEKVRREREREEAELRRLDAEAARVARRTQTSDASTTARKAPQRVLWIERSGQGGKFGEYVRLLRLGKAEGNREYVQSALGLSTVRKKPSPVVWRSYTPDHYRAAVDIRRGFVDAMPPAPGVSPERRRERASVSPPPGADQRSGKAAKGQNKARFIGKSTLAPMMSPELAEKRQRRLLFQAMGHPRGVHQPPPKRPAEELSPALSSLTGVPVRRGSPGPAADESSVKYKLRAPLAEQPPHPPLPPQQQQQQQQQQQSPQAAHNPPAGASDDEKPSPNFLERRLPAPMDIVVLRQGELLTRLQEFRPASPAPVLSLSPPPPAAGDERCASPLLPVSRGLNL